MYILRTCNPSRLEEVLLTFDHLQQNSLEEILGVYLDTPSWTQATLPVPLGGMGLREAITYAPVAYVSSIIQSLPLVRAILGNDRLLPSTDIALQMVREASDDRSFTLEALAAEETPQKRLSHAVDLHRQNLILSSAKDQRTQARLRSLSLPHAGAWLNAVPSKPLGLHLLPQEFRLASLYRLGLPVYPSHLSSCPSCGKEIDALGDHAILRQ